MTAMTAAEAGGARPVPPGGDGIARVNGQAAATAAAVEEEEEEEGAVLSSGRNGTVKQARR
jgi:hypothetical protein